MTIKIADSRWLAVLLWLIPSAHLSAKPILLVDFEDIALADESIINDSFGFTSRGATFNNTFTDFGSFTFWNGWSVSNRTDTTTIGVTNQYSAIAGSGADGSRNFGVGFHDLFTPLRARIDLPTGAEPVSAEVTNTTYDFFAIRDGDDGAGFVSGPFEPGDFFTLTIVGLDAGNAEVGSVDFDLARDTTVLDDWTTVDLTSLQGLDVTALEFELATSDVGPFGPNTPFYFALDNLALLTQDVGGPGGSVVTPEPSTLVLSLVVLFVAWVAWAIWRRRERRSLG